VGNAGFRFDTVAAVSGGERIGGRTEIHERIDAKQVILLVVSAVHRVVAAEANVTASKSRVGWRSALTTRRRIYRRKAWARN